MEGEKQDGLINREMFGSLMLTWMAAKVGEGIIEMAVMMYIQGVKLEHTRSHGIQLYQSQLYKNHLLQNKELQQQGLQELR